MTVSLIIFIAAEAVLAIILCFFGYKTRRILVAIYSFMAAFYIIYPFFSGKTDLPSLMTIIICAGIALICSCIITAVYNIAMFVSGGGIGFVAGIFLCFYFSIEITSVAGLVIIAALTLASSSLSVAYKKPLCVLSSSVLGAFIVSILSVYTYTVINLSSGSLADSVINIENAPSVILNTAIPMFDYVLIGTTALGLIGALIQFSPRKKH